MEPASWLAHYLELAAPYLREYGYGAVFIGVLVEGFGIPAPGQSLIVAGALFAARGQMQIAALLPLAWVAAVIGDNIGYAIGRYGGRRLVLRHGRHVGVRAAHLDRVQHFFGRYGGGIVMAARFFEVLRQFNGVVAGVSGMNWWRFFGYNAVGAALWVGVWGYGVYRVGRHMDQLLALFKRAEPYVIGAGLLALVGLAMYLFQRGTDGERKS